MAEAGRASPTRGVIPDASKTSSAFVCSKRGHVARGDGCAGRNAALALAFDASKASSAFDATGGHVGRGAAETRPPPPLLVRVDKLPPPSLVGAGTSAAVRLGQRSERRVLCRCWTVAGAETRRVRSAVAGAKAKQWRLRDAPDDGGDGLGPMERTADVTERMAAVDSAIAAAVSCPNAPRYFARCGSNERHRVSAAVPGGVRLDAPATSCAQKTVLPHSGRRSFMKQQPSSVLLLNRSVATLGAASAAATAAAVSCSNRSSPPVVAPHVADAAVSGEASATTASEIATGDGEGNAPPPQQGMPDLVARKLCLAYARASSTRASAIRNELMPVHAALPKRNASCFSATPNFAMRS